MISGQMMSDVSPVQHDAMRRWAEGAPCPICGSAARTVARLPWGRYRHVDFSNFAPAPLVIMSCDQCGMAGAVTDKIEALYLNSDYAAHAPSIHAVRPPGSGASVPAPDHQAELIGSRLPGPPQAVLDVGSFDGRLLRAIAARFPLAKRVAYDVNPNMRKFFPVGDGVQFFADLDSIRGPFDLVTISQSLMYVRDALGLLVRVKTWLTPEGRIFIHVPDVERKPSGLLFGDLHHHFTRTGLLNLLASAGCRAETVEPTGFTRDLLVIAWAGPANRLTPPDRAIDRATKQLFAMKHTVSSLGSSGHRWNILGTTIDAAFVADVLGRAAGDFLDESPFEHGASFHGHPIRHPRSLNEGESTILPLGEAATAALDRFRSEYRGRFVLV